MCVGVFSRQDPSFPDAFPDCMLTELPEEDTMQTAGAW